MAARPGSARRWAATSSLVACGFAAACGAFGGDAGDPPDAAADAPAEGGAPGDDAGDGAADGARRFCETVDAAADAAFCADFDGVDWKEGWDSPGAQVIGGAISPDPEAYSPPVALRSETVGNGTGPNAAPLSLTFPITGRSARAHFRVRVPPSHPSAYAHFVAVRFGGQFSQFVLGQAGADLVLREQPLRPDAGTLTSYVIANGRVDTGAWVEVDLRIALGGSIQLEIDGKLVLSTKVTLADAAPPLVVFYLGLWSEPADASWTASYDDVVLEAR